jgi:hypothetical protein
MKKIILITGAVLVAAISFGPSLVQNETKKSEPVAQKAPAKLRFENLHLDPKVAE